MIPTADLKIDIVQAIRYARADATLRIEAGKLAGHLIAEAFAHDHDRKPGALRGSDAGNCARQVWADVHGKFDIPEDVDAQLTSMDRGTLMGAWYAALFKYGLEAQWPSLIVTCEVEIDKADFTGHIDAFVERIEAAGYDNEHDLIPLLVAEFKNSGAMGPPREPLQPNKQKGSLGIFETREYHVLQAVRYAIEREAPLAVVVTSTPGGIRQDEYVVADWRERVDADFARLRAALGDTEPPGDPQQGFRCASCRYGGTAGGGCPKNQNPARSLA